MFPRIAPATIIPLFCLIALVLFNQTGVEAQTISLPDQPGLQAAYDAARNRLYVPISGDNVVAIIDMNTYSVIDSFGTNAEPVGIDISPDATMLAVSNKTAKTLQLFNIATQAQIDSYNLDPITTHRPGEVAFMVTGKIIFGYQNDGTGSPVFKQVSAWDPTAGILTTFGPLMHEPHYISRSADRQTAVIFEANQNPAWGIAFDGNLSEISRNTSVPTDYSGTVPFNPGYNIACVNDDGTRFFAGKNTYDRNFTYIVQLPVYNEPIFLRDNTVLALSNDTGANFEAYARMDSASGSTLATGNLPVPVSDLPGTFLVRASHSSTPAGTDRICAVDRGNNRVVVFSVNIEPIATAARLWHEYEVLE